MASEKPRKSKEPAPASQNEETAAGESPAVADLKPRSRGPSFSLDFDFHIVEIESHAATLLGLTASELTRFDSCRNLQLSDSEAIADALKSLKSQPDGSCAYTRLNLPIGVERAQKPFCLTLRKATKDGFGQCTCVLEEIATRLDASNQSYKPTRLMGDSGIVVWSLDERTLEFIITAPLHGVDYSEPIQKICSLEDWLTHIHPMDRDEFLRRIRSFLAGKSPNFHQRYRIQTADGKEKLISTIARRKSGEVDNPQILGLHRDSRDIPNLAGELRLLSFLAKNVNSPLLITDPEGRVSWLNQAFTEMSQYELTDALRKRPGEFLQGPKSDRKVIRYMSEQIKKGKGFHADLVNYTKSGNPYWTRIDANPLVDNKGKLTHFIAFQTDVSTQKNGLSQSENGEIEFRSVFENAIDPILLVSDKSETILDANRKARVFFSNNYLTNLKLSSIISFGDAIKWHSLLETDTSELPLKQTITLDDGTQLPVELSIAKIPAADAAMLTLRDASEKGKLEEQLRHSQRMEAVGKLSGAIAHDFNNLLAGIRGFAELLESSPNIPKKEQSFVRELLKNADRGSALTGRLLTYSRKKETAPNISNITETVNGFIPMLSRILKADINFSSNLDTAAVNSKYDIDQIEQVIMNLVVNAQEATRGAGARIALRTGNAELTGKENFITGAPEPGRYATLEVEDNGHGMSQNLLDRIFEPFFTTKEGVGTGLGLSIVFGIIKSNNAHLEVQSAENEGTLFRVYFKEVDEPVFRLEKEDSQGQPFETRTVTPATILVAEDQPHVREILEIALSESGYTVLCAEDGLDAVQKSNDHTGNIDMLLTDAMMPKMSGQILAAKIRQSHPKIKVILMSGLPQDEITNGLGEEGLINAFVDKPFSVRELIGKIDKMLKARNPKP